MLACTLPLLAAYSPTPALRYAPLAPARVSSVVMEDKFSQTTRLRSEAESPFSKLRLFLLPALFAGAGVATYFGGTSALAEVAGLRPASPDTLGNLAIDIGSLGTIGFLWQRELGIEEKRMKRIAAGAALAKLRVQQLVGPRAGKSTKLVDLRSGRGSDPFDESSRRVIIVAAEEAPLGDSLAAARARSAAIAEADLLVVPLLLRNGRVEIPPPEWVVPQAAGSEDSLAHVALAQGVEAWRDVLSEELETATGQDPNIGGRGLTLILKKNGRVGTRRLGLPDWVALTADVAARAGAGLDTRNI